MGEEDGDCTGDGEEKDVPSVRVAGFEDAETEHDHSEDDSDIYGILFEFLSVVDQLARGREKECGYKEKARREKLSAQDEKERNREQGGDERNHPQSPFGGTKNESGTIDEEEKESGCSLIEVERGQKFEEVPIENIQSQHCLVDPETAIVEVVIETEDEGEAKGRQGKDEESALGGSGLFFDRRDKRALVHD